MIYCFSRKCDVCNKTFRTERGLKLHASKSGSASQCSRYHEMSSKAAKIRRNRERRQATKNVKIADTDFSNWNGKIPKGTHYGTNEKIMCLNLISVRKMHN